MLPVTGGACFQILKADECKHRLTFIRFFYALCRIQVCCDRYVLVPDPACSDVTFFISCSAIRLRGSCAYENKHASLPPCDILMSMKQLFVLVLIVCWLAPAFAFAPLRTQHFVFYAGAEGQKAAAYLAQSADAILQTHGGKPGHAGGRYDRCVCGAGL